MPLIVCPDCSTSVSDAAASCPKCARPMRAVVIEQTSKRWKAATLIGLMLMAGGCVGCIGSTAAVGRPDSGVVEVLGVALFFMLWLAGIGLVVVSRVGAWWHHG